MPHSSIHNLQAAIKGLTYAMLAFCRDGRRIIMDRAEARTELEKLSVEQKRMEIETQRTMLAINVAKEIDGLQDAALKAHIKTELPRYKLINNTDPHDAK